ncbi:hypothetical protein J6590_102559, partial [Homalodisca vitripennis]
VYVLFYSRLDGMNIGTDFRRLSGPDRRQNTVINRMKVNLALPSQAPCLSGLSENPNSITQAIEDLQLDPNCCFTGSQYLGSQHLRIRFKKQKRITTSDHHALRHTINL